MELFKIFGSVAVKNNEAKESLDDVNNHAKTVASQMGQSFETIGTAFSKIGDGMSKAGTLLTATLTTGLGALAVQGIKYNAQMETFEANLTTLLGSSDKASKLLEDLQQMASTTPYETTDLISATQTMVGFGISAQDAQDYLNVLGDIAMGDSQKMQGLALAFSQVQSTGRLTGQDLLQMINQGFNPLLYISKMTGKSMGELKEEMGEGKISAEMVADAFEYATQKGQPFYQAMEKGADTVNGRISTLKDNFNIMIGNLTESLLPIFEKVVDKLIDLTEKFSNLSDAQKEQILKWAGIAMAIGPVLIVLGKLTSGIGTVVSITGKLITAFSSGTGLAGSISGVVTACGGLAPFLGIIAGAVAGVIAVVVFLKKHWDKVTEAFQRFAENTGLAQKFEEIKAKLQPLWEKLKQLGDLFEVIGGAIVTALQPAFAVLMGLFNAVVSAIGPLLDALGGIIDVLAGIGTFIKSVFTGDWQGAWDAIKKIGQGIVDTVVGLFQAIWNFIKGFDDGVKAWIKSLFDTLGITELIEKIKNAFNKFKDNLAQIFTNIKTAVSQKVENIKSAIVDKFNSAKDKVVSTFNKVKDAIIKPIQTARDTVKGIVDKIKGFFNFDFKLPKIKLPKFSIQPSGWKIGDLLKGSIPKLGITWNKDGAIFSQPTIFDTRNGLQGVGEAGPEAIAPISKLQDYVKVAVENSNTALEEKLDTLANILLKYLPAIENQQMVLDTGALVGEITTKMDRSLGDLTNKRARGR